MDYSKTFLVPAGYVEWLTYILGRLKNGTCNTLGVCHSLSSGFELKHDRLSRGEPNLNLDVTPLLCI
jgi:hypothetical protein